jgi:cytochrome bd-type quinol oxidase subunit 2
MVFIETLFVRPQLFGKGIVNPLSWVGVIVVAGSVRMLVSGILRNQELRAFLGSNFFIAGILATGSATIYPVMLLSSIAPEYSLRAEQVASSASTLKSALFWWPLAFVMAASYFVFISRRYSGKVSVKRDTQGYY